MSNSDWLKFCKRELELAGAFDEESMYGGLVGITVMELCETFDAQNHSGVSAAVVARLFTRLVRWEPLTPLTGEDWEWRKLSNGDYQNIRCPTVFKDKDGRAYQSDYYIFVDENGASYTSHESRKYIDKFPYWPTHEYVRVSNDNPAD